MSDRDDDWFELAVGEDAPTDDERDADSGANPPEDEDDDWFLRATGGADDTPDDPDRDPERPGSDGIDAGPDESVPDHPEDDAASSGGSGRASDADHSTDADTGDDARGSLFDDDFGSALEQADLPDGIDGSSTGEEFGGGGSRGGEFGSAGDFGGGGDFGGDDFGGGGDFGGDDFGGGGDFGGGSQGDTFDEDEVDSDIPRLELGIDGLDAMIQGGVPERSLMVAIGSAGTGKTTFGLQFLDHGLRQGERGVYITLEESRERMINSAIEKGMPFDEYAERGDLAILDLDPVEMANSLASIRSELPRLIDDFDASRLVLDSVSLLEMMYDDRAKRRNEIYDFTKSLKRSGVTTMMTSEASESSPYNSRHGIVEYLTDAVFVLQYVRPSDFRETRLAIEIQKIRDANHSRETKPYDITGEGISVYRQANIF